MKLRLSDVPAEGRLYTGEEPPVILGLESQEDIRVLSGTRYELRAYNVPGALYVKGSIEVDAELICSRCGQKFTTTVRDTQMECARELTLGDAPTLVPDPVDPAVIVPELADSEDRSDPECVDLTGDIREAMILALPLYPVCQPECRGLCPKCGTDLNKASCRCCTESDGRWGMLDTLHL